VPPALRTQFAVLDLQAEPVSKFQNVRRVAYGTSHLSCIPSLGAFVSRSALGLMKSRYHQEGICACYSLRVVHTYTLVG